MQKQVDKSHYNFKTYVHKQRWISIWHQVDEVANLKPNKVLEIGPGPGLFKASSTAIGLNVKTLDIDPSLNPDYVASVFEMPFKDGEFDVVCAFQMLEHLPYEKSIEAFKEMTRVARVAVVISLPDAATRWPFLIHIPKFGPFHFSIPRPRIKKPLHKFDGEHYWEINKLGYSESRITSDLLRHTPTKLKKSFRVPENPYHHFYVFHKIAP